MADKRNKTASFIENVGAQVCESAHLTVSSVGKVIGSAVSAVRRCSAPAGQDAVKFLKGLVKGPVSFINSKRENAAEVFSRFKRRTKIFGVRKAAFMQWREHRLAVRRKGSKAASLFTASTPLCPPITVLPLSMMALRWAL